MINKKFRSRMWDKKREREREGEKRPSGRGREEGRESGIETTRKGERVKTEKKE